MKVITLVPVRNEAWILPYSLKNFSDFSDHILVADQRSTDNTREICASFDKVQVIENPYSGHSNKVRWLLLDEARKIPGHNLIVCLDADELISPDFTKEINADTRPGTTFSSRWIQLWDKGSSYRTDGPWKESTKAFAFFDDGTMDYSRAEVINDHTARIPESKTPVTISQPILHLQYLATRRCATKQAWYMCQELLDGADPRRINHKYAAARTDEVRSAAIDPDWIAGIALPPREILETEDESRLTEILSLFSQKGIVFFEPLNIWSHAALHARFVQETARQPRAKFYPAWLVFANQIRNILRNFFRT